MKCKHQMRNRCHNVDLREGSHTTTDREKFLLVNFVFDLYNALIINGFFDMKKLTVLPPYNVLVINTL